MKFTIAVVDYPFAAIRGSRSVAMCMLVALALLTLSSKAPGGILKVGSPADSGTGNCGPFGCGHNGEYQQVYNKGAFSGPITIDALDFYATQPIKQNLSATAINPGTWQIALTTTSADWNTLSTDRAANLGTDETVVFNGDLAQPWTFGDTLTIGLSSPFTYDPSKGNLLMDVISSKLPVIGSPDSSSIYFDTNGYNNQNYGGNSIMGQVLDNGTVYPGYGLVTGFDTVNAPVQSVPAPPTVLLVGPGLIALAARRPKLSQHK